MHYEDPERSANVLAGLAVGAVLGAGLTMLVSPGRMRSGRRWFKRRVK